MVEETRKHFLEMGLREASAEQLAVSSRDFFSLGSYTWQAFLLALVVGTVLSAILMIFLRKKTVVDDVAQPAELRAN